MTPGRAALLVVLAGLAGLAAVWTFVPEYLLARGLPLDDAWIHAVYGRSLARSGMLAFNPGVPATGVTSPLWALILAVPHGLTSHVPLWLFGVKLLGFTLHLGAALLLLRAFTEQGRVGLAGLTGCMLAAFHPDLVSASLSGMEVALATVVASGLLLAATGSGPLWFGLLSFVAPLVRPELTLLCAALPVALLVRRDHRRLLTLSAAACLGSALAYGLIGARNLALAGHPFPSTVYPRAAGMIDAEITGFRDVLGHLPVVDASILLVIAALMALRVAAARQAVPAPLQHAAAALLAGLVVCAVSFALLPPLDPRAFYHQRHVLPALAFIVAAIPVLLCGVLERLVPERARPPVRVALAGLLVLSVVVVAPVRYGVLSDDARSTDDLQVGIGRHLASTRPAEVVWAVDTGAVRYFGNAFVVDLLGLDHAGIRGPGAQRFLDDHPPRFIEAVPTWSSVDAAAIRRLTAIPFQTPALDLVRSDVLVQRRWLILCHDPTVSGRVAIRDRTVEFRCAPP